jgi:hypothetical protein
MHHIKSLWRVRFEKGRPSCATSCVCVCAIARARVSLYDLRDIAAEAVDEIIRGRGERPFPPRLSLKGKFSKVSALVYLLYI